jgi:hypothetical protein
LLAKFICQLSQIKTNNLNGQELIFNTAIVEQFQMVLRKEKNSIIFFRVFDILLKLAAVSYDTLEKCIKIFELNAIINATIGSDDVLSKLNCIEVLIELALTSHGYYYLTDLGVLGQLANYFNSNFTETDPFVQLVLPGLNFHFID